MSEDRAMAWENEIMEKRLLKIINEKEGGIKK